MNAALKTAAARLSTIMRNAGIQHERTLLLDAFAQIPQTTAVQWLIDIGEDIQRGTAAIHQYETLVQLVYACSTDFAQRLQNASLQVNFSSVLAQSHTQSLLAFAQSVKLGLDPATPVPAHASYSGTAPTYPQFLIQANVLSACEGGERAQGAAQQSRPAPASSDRTVGDEPQSSHVDLRTTGQEDPITSGLRRKVKVYAKESAFTLEVMPLKSSAYREQQHGQSNSARWPRTIMIEAAKAIGGIGNGYDWQNKTQFALSQDELPDLLAVIERLSPEASFEYHGTLHHNKTLSLKNQDGSLLLNLRVGPHRLLAPAPDRQRYSLALLVMSVLKHNEPDLDASAIHTVIRSLYSDPTQ